MGSNAVFRDLVHRDRTDLQLHALLARADHGRVDRAVVVPVVGPDVVFGAARPHRPRTVHDAERLVAVGQRLHDDAKPEDIGQLLEADGLPFHLPPDRIGALAPSNDARVDAPIGQFFGELFYYFVYYTHVCVY